MSVTLFLIWCGIAFLVIWTIRIFLEKKPRTIHCNPNWEWKYVGHMPKPTIGKGTEIYIEFEGDLGD